MLTVSTAEEQTSPMLVIAADNSKSEGALRDSAPAAAPEAKMPCGCGSFLARAAL